MQDKLRILILSLSLVLFGFSFSYAQSNKTDGQGRKQGSWVKYKDGVKFYQGQFKDDKPVGEFLRYYKSGRLLSRSVFNENGSECIAEIYYDARKKPLKAKGKYILQQKDSLWIYYNKTGVLVKEERYQNGVEDGMWKLYNYVGALMKETPYEQGIINGVQNEYFDNGSLLRTMSFNNDVLDGSFKVFFPDGKLRIEGVFVNGSQDKDWIHYGDDNKVYYIEKYDNGVLLERVDEEGNLFELPIDQDTVRIEKTPEELMEIR